MNARVHHRWLQRCIPSICQYASGNYATLHQDFAEPLTERAEIFPRGVHGLIVDALADTRVVFVLGARQVGKSTLSRRIAEHDHPAQIINLDERAAREAALSDPEGFVAGLAARVLIDEVQRGGPDLLLAIKKRVDSDLTPGQFLLTGSANVLRNRNVTDALTGRTETVQLWPLAQAEIESSIRRSLIDRLFAGDPPAVTGATTGRDALKGRIAVGGYPEARTRSSSRRARWFSSYLRTTFERDLAEISEAQKLHHIPQLMRLLASQSAGLLAPATMGKKLGLDHRTVDSYVGLLETLFLIVKVPAWRPGFGQREVQHAKSYIADSGLLLHLLGVDESRLLADDRVTGIALETFVALELLKHAEWSDEAPRVFHYRRGRDELDLVLENRAGHLVGIEVKAKASLSRSDWRVLAKLRDARSRDFKCGIVLHTGEQTVPLGDRLYGMPLSGLWA